MDQAAHWALEPAKKGGKKNQGAHKGAKDESGYQKAAKRA
jgi:hypothetical protein